MIPVTFKEANKIFKSGDGMMDIPTHWDGRTMVSCHQLSKEDLEIINKTGRVWVSQMCPTVYPMKVLAESPFAMPRLIDVTESAIGRVFLVLFDGNEIIALHINADEKEFKIEEEKNAGKDTWVVTAEMEGLPGSRFQTDFTFWEPVKILGKANELHGMYDVVADHMKWPVNEVLIMERVIKTDLSNE